MLRKGLEDQIELIDYQKKNLNGKHQRDQDFCQSEELRALSWRGLNK